MPCGSKTDLREPWRLRTTGPSSRATKTVTSGRSSGTRMARMSIEPHDPRAAVDALYATLDPLAFPARMRALATWTRNQVGNGDGAGGIRPLLDELNTRGLHGRRLAVVAAVIGGDVGFLVARLADPDATVRGHALKSTVHLPIGDAALERAMDDAPEAVRRQVATAVLAGGRTALAERLIVSVREQWGDGEAARLLPGCGAEAVERLLPGLFLAVSRWRALGRRYPDLVLDEAARQLAELPEPSRTDWWQRNADIFPATVEARPLRVLDLLERHCPVRLPGPVRDCLGPLLKAAPGRTIGLITAPGRLVGHPRGRVSRTALSRLARLGPPELVELGRAWSHDQEFLALLLLALPPSRRDTFYDAATAGQDLSHSSLSSSLLEALPRRRAQSEARRMAAQAAERGASWDTVLAAVAYLPSAKARAQLLAGTRRPAAEDRALAWPLLVRNAARSGESAAIAALVDDLQRLRNEQEPVRSPALTALAEVPPGLFADTDTTLLDRIAINAIEARDSSGRTRQALSSLALALLREHAVSGDHAWGGGQPTYPLVFHPLELGEEALRAFAGFVLEGRPLPGDVDPDTVPLNGYRVTDPDGPDPARGRVEIRQRAAAMRPHRVLRFNADGTITEA